MNFGFNQNVTYQGEVYHVQTEDGGRKSPVITTILFKGGVIVETRRTDYSDIIRSAHLEDVVADLMREQHRAVISDLRKGLFAGKSG